MKAHNKALGLIPITMILLSANGPISLAQARAAGQAGAPATAQSRPITPKGILPLLTVLSILENSNEFSFRIGINYPMENHADLLTSGFLRCFALDQPDTKARPSVNDSVDMLLRALQFADGTCNYELGDLLRKKAISLSRESVGDYNHYSFSYLITVAHYLDETGHAEEAGTMYRNMLTTAFDFGVPPSYCSSVMLAYAKYLKAHGNDKDAAPLWQELGERCAKNPDGNNLYGLAGPELAGWPHLRANVSHFYETSNWDWDGKANEGYQISQHERPQNWKTGFKALEAIEHHKNDRAAQLVSRLFIEAPAAPGTESDSISCLINLANAYTKQNQAKEARQMLEHIKELTAAPALEEPRLYVTAELALLDANGKQQVQSNWKNLEHILQEMNDEYYSSMGGPGTANQPEQNAEREKHLIETLIDLAIAYSLNNEPAKALTILKLTLANHDPDKYQKPLALANLALMQAQVGKFDEAIKTVDALPPEEGFIVTHMRSDVIGRVVATCRAAGKTVIAEQIARKGLQQSSGKAPAVSFQLGLIEMQQRHYFEAQRELQAAMDNTHFYLPKIPIIVAMSKSFIEQGKYDEALNCELDFGEKQMGQKQPLAPAILDALQHKTSCDENTIMRVFRQVSQAFYKDNGLGAASLAGKLTAIATAQNWPPAKMSILNEMLAPMYPRAKRFATTAMSSPSPAGPESTYRSPAAGPQSLHTSAAVGSGSMGASRLDTAKAAVLTSQQPASIAIPLGANTYNALIMQAKRQMEFGETANAINTILAALDAPDPNHSRVWTNLEMKSLQIDRLTALKQYGAVEKILKRCIATRPQSPPPEEIVYLAKFYADRGRFEEAQTIVAPVLADRLANPRGFVIGGGTWGLVGDQEMLGLIELAKIFLEKKEAQRAERLAKDILAIQQTWLGPVNPSLITTFEVLAKAYQLQNKSKLEAQNLEHAFAISARTLDYLQGGIVGAQQRYAEILRNSGRAKEADAVMTNRPQSPSNFLLGDGINSHQDLSGSAREYAMVDEQQKIVKYFGPVTRVNAQMLDSLAYFYTAINDYPKAIKALLEEAQIYDDLDGRCNNQSALCMTKLASVYCISKDIDQAKSWLAKAKAANILGNDIAISRLTSAYFAVLELKLGDKGLARIRAVEATRPDGMLPRERSDKTWEVILSECVKVLDACHDTAKINELESQEKVRIRNRYPVCGNAVDRSQPELILSLIPL